MMMLSAAAVSSTQQFRTLQFPGLIRGVPIRILIDSGSSHSFLSSIVASQLPDVRQLSQPVSVKVADGSAIVCSSELAVVEWSMQGFSFHSNLKILPLCIYDLNLGMDWLEAFSPMKINWQQKWMSISYGSQQVLFQGNEERESECAVIQLFCIAADTTEPNEPTLCPKIQAVIDQYKHLFAEPSSLPPHCACDHKIPLVAGAQPVAVRQYRYSPALQTELETQVSDMLQAGLIQPSTSSFSSPVLLVHKKDSSQHFCIDYRLLNSLTVKSKFPIPVIDELLDELSSARWFTSLDQRAGFNQIRLAPGEEHKTAFQTHWGHFEFTIMAFGLTRAPNTLQGAMNTTLHPLLRKCVLVFFDDILIYSRTLEEHIVHLQQVLALLEKDGWLLKMSKCHFAKQEIAYLGHVISAKGISTDPSKIASIQAWARPQDVNQLRSFLGLTGYYRKFVQNYALLAHPLTDLPKKGSLFAWTPAHDAAFEALKTALVTAPVLALPDFHKQFQIHTDASDHGVGAVLIQDGHPIAFVSKALGPRTRGLSTYDKEYLAILVVVDQWRSYLQHAEFVIYSDHRSLMHLSD